MQPSPPQVERPRRRAGFALALLFVLALLVGCGGESGETGAGQPDSAEGTGAAVEGEGTGESAGAPRLSEKPISKRAFRRRANRICEATVGTVLARAAPIIKEAKGNSEADREEAEAELMVTVMAPELRREVNRIRALGTPPGDRRQIERILAAVLDVADEAEDKPESLAGYNQTFFARSTNLAERYGLEACPYG